MADLTSTRRGVLGAIAGMPVAAAFGTIPAAALSANRHATWLTERNRINDRVNTSRISDEEAEALVDQMIPLETNITRTPAANVEEARVKLRYAAQIHREGACLGQHDASELLAELANWFAAGGF